MIELDTWITQFGVRTQKLCKSQVSDSCSAEVAGRRAPLPNTSRLAIRDPPMDPYALDIQANTKDMTERPITKDIEAKQPPPPSREDQERPREGQCQMERIPGRPV